MSQNNMYIVPVASWSCMHCPLPNVFREGESLLKYAYRQHFGTIKRDKPLSDVYMHSPSNDRCWGIVKYQSSEGRLQISKHTKGRHFIFFKKKSNTSSGSSSSSKLPSSSGSSSVERIISMLKTACHDSTAHKINGHHLHISVASWCWVHRVMTKHESCVQYLIEHYLPENVLTCSWATRNQQGDRLRTQEPLNWYSCVLASHMTLHCLHYMSISNSFTITIVVPWDLVKNKDCN